MQREIKFRAHCQGRLYLVTELLWSEQAAFIWNNTDPEHEGEKVDLYNIDLMQFTGLKDETGRDIFEGDIVRSSGREIGVVDFSEGAFVLCVYKDGEIHHEEIAAEEDAWEVIGNIYENPELLK